MDLKNVLFSEKAAPGWAPEPADMLIIGVSITTLNPKLLKVSALAAMPR